MTTKDARPEHAESEISGSFAPGSEFGHGLQGSFVDQVKAEEAAARRKSGKEMIVTGIAALMLTGTIFAVGVATVNRDVAKRNAQKQAPQTMAIANTLRK